MFYYIEEILGLVSDFFVFDCIENVVVFFVVFSDLCFLSIFVID